MNYIVGEHGSKTKASMVFVYGSGGKCTNIYYTKTKYSASPIDNSSPTFTDLSLTNLQNVYDSLVYSPSYNRVDKLFRLTLGTRQPYGIIQFSYSDNSDTSINKIEEYRFDANGKQFLHDQLLITPDVTPCPITKLFWFQPFVGDCCTDFLVESPSGKLQLLYDGPSTDVDRFLPMASNRFVKGYKVYNSWGLENYTHTTFDYKYSADSLTLDTSTPQDPSVSVQWRFKKARR